MDGQLDQWSSLDRDHLNIHASENGVHPQSLTLPPSFDASRAPFDPYANHDSMQNPPPTNFNSHLWRPSQDFGGPPLHSHLSGDSEPQLYSTAGDLDPSAVYACSDPPMPAYYAFDDEFAMGQSALTPFSWNPVTQPPMTNSTQDPSMRTFQHMPPALDHNQPFMADAALTVSSSHDPTDIYGDDLDLHGTPYNNLARYTFDGGADAGVLEADDEGTSHKPYNIIIFGFLWHRPSNTAMLKEIYEHVAEACGKDLSQSGWKNSVRHNLSLNNAFEKAKGDCGKKKTSVWRLSKEALQSGKVFSTTKYRKQSQRKKKSNGGQPSVKRQESGAKGGRATRDSARRAKNAKNTKHARTHHPGHAIAYLAHDQASSIGPSTPSTAYSRVTSASPQIVQYHMPQVPYPPHLQSHQQPPSSNPHSMQPMQEEMPQLYQPHVQHLPSQSYDNFDMHGPCSERVMDDNDVYMSETPPLTSDTDMSVEDDGFNAHSCITSYPATSYGGHEQACGA